MFRELSNWFEGRKRNPKEKISFKDLGLLLERINGWTLINGVNLKGYINSSLYKFKGADPEAVALFLKSGYGVFQCERQVYSGKKTEIHYFVLTKGDFKDTKVEISYVLPKGL